MFNAKVLPLPDPVTRALLGRFGQACRDAALRNPKPKCAGRTVGVKLQSGCELRWVRQDADLGQDARMPVDRSVECTRRCGLPRRGVEVDAGARLPVG